MQRDWRAQPESWPAGPSRFEQRDLFREAERVSLEQRGKIEYLRFKHGSDVQKKTHR